MVVVNYLDYSVESEVLTRDALLYVKLRNARS